LVRLTDILSEVGDAGKPLKWKLVKRSPKSVIYIAQSSKQKGLEYNILILKDPEESSIWDIIFMTRGKYSADAVTNIGEPLRIIATVVECVEHHFKKIVLPNRDTIDFEGYEFSGTHKGSDSERGATSRTRIYTMFLNKSPLVKKYFDIIAAGNMVQLLLKDQYMK